MPPRSATADLELPVADADRARLQQLGYKQELKRGLSLLSNFAFSFSIISVLAGVTTTYNTGLRYGGPASMALGWLVVAAFNGCVALSMAEICSAYPTSGGLYYWSAKLAGGEDWAPLASWVTGWFNIVGQWACTTSVDFSLAQFVQVIVLLSTGGANGGGYMASKYVVLAIYCAILILHGLINSLSIHWLAWFGQLGAFWNLAGVFALTVLIPAFAKERASMEFVFTHCYSDNGVGIHSKVYTLVASHWFADEPILPPRIRHIRPHVRGDQERGLEWPDGDRRLRSPVERLRMDLPGVPDVHRHRHPLPPGPQQRRRRELRRPSPVQRLPLEVRQRRRRDRVPGRHGRRHIPLRHGVRDQQLEDGVRLLQGRRHALLARLVPGEQAGGALQRRLALRLGGVRHGPHVAGEPGGVPGDGVHHDAGEWGCTSPTRCPSSSG